MPSTNLPVITIVGQPNVGKSTLFNRLTQTRDALVADLAGVTRDRQYGTATFNEHHFILIDTGGIADAAGEIEDKIKQQVDKAIDESDVLLFMIDAQQGITTQDLAIVDKLRKVNKPTYLLVNKIDSVNIDDLSADCFAMGFGAPFYLVATQHKGINKLLEAVFADLPAPTEIPEADLSEQGIQLAVIGRPNAGKSTLINQILGEERMMVSDIAGTTRDSIFIPFQRGKQKYTLVDTAGMRRRSKINDAVEKFSIIKTMQAIESSHVVIVMLNAQEEIAEQDLRLIKLSIESGRALVLAVNKWDDLSNYERDRIKKAVDRRLSFANFADLHFISALKGSGLKNLFHSVEQAYASATQNLSTHKLTHLLMETTEKHQPPIAQGRRIKLRYAHAGGKNPPLIVIHGKQATALPLTYQQYLVNTFRKHLGLHGTPIQLKLKDDHNPYA